MIGEWASGTLLLRVRGGAFEGQQNELSEFSPKHPSGRFSSARLEAILKLM